MISQDSIHTQEGLVARYSTKSISLYIVLVVVVVISLLLLPYISIDISSQSRGMVRSSQDKVPIQTVVSGQIIHCTLQNNQWVQQGDTLVVVAQEELQTQKDNMQTLAQDHLALIGDLQRAIHHHDGVFTTSVMTQEWYNYISHRAELLGKISYAQQEYQRYQTLFDKGVIAQGELDKYVHNFAGSKQALAVYDKSQNAQWENRCRELQEKVTNYKGSINKIRTEGKKYCITAPVTGVIENFVGLQQGSFLNASTTIATIAPMHHLLVECTVLPNDIGLIQPNQKVKFQLDAFNYNQWGLLEGKVIDIDKNITIQENQSFFKVRCVLQSTQLQLKSGYKTQVSNGMTLTARYMITRRSLYDLLFDKMDDWLNPKVL